MGQSQPLFLYFRFFTFQSKWQIYNLNCVNWKKWRNCAGNSNLGRQDGRRRRIHWAMAAPHALVTLLLCSIPKLIDLRNSHCHVKPIDIRNTFSFLKIAISRKLEVFTSQCDRFIQFFLYFAICNNERLSDSIIFGPRRIKILPSTKLTLQTTGIETFRQSGEISPNRVTLQWRDPTT